VALAGVVGDREAFQIMAKDEREGLVDVLLGRPLRNRWDLDRGCEKELVLSVVAGAVDDLAV